MAKNKSGTVNAVRNPPQKPNVRALIIIYLLSLSLFFTHGIFDPDWITVLPLILLLAFWKSLNIRIEGKKSDLIYLVLLASFLLLIIFGLGPSGMIFPKLIIYTHDEFYLTMMQALFTFCLLLLLPLYLATQRKDRTFAAPIIFYSILLSATIALVLVIFASPSPIIDVWADQERTVRAFVDWINPYTLKLDNFYNPGATRATPHMNYLPGFLLWLAPWKLLNLDIRFGFVWAHLLCTYFIFKISLRSFSDAKFFKYVPALLFLFCPITPFLIEQSWNDHLGCLAAVLAVYGLTARTPYLFYAGINALLLSKQYHLIATPTLLWLGQKRFDLNWPRFLLLSTWFSVLVYAAFLIADANIFLEAIFQFKNLVQGENRTDSLSIMNWFYLNTGLKTSILFPALAVLASIKIWVEDREKTDLKGGVDGLGLLFLLFFMFSPKAHINYYWFALIFYFLSFSLGKNEQGPSKIIERVKGELWAKGL